MSSFISAIRSLCLKSMYLLNNISMFFEPTGFCEWIAKVKLSGMAIRPDISDSTSHFARSYPLEYISPSSEHPKSWSKLIKTGKLLCFLICSIQSSTFRQITYSLLSKSDGNLSSSRKRFQFSKR